MTCLEQPSALAQQNSWLGCTKGIFQIHFYIFYKSLLPLPWLWLWKIYLFALLLPIWLQLKQIPLEPTQKAAFSEEQVFFYSLSSDLPRLTQQNTPMWCCCRIYLWSITFSASRSCQTDRVAFEMNRPSPLLMPQQGKKKQDIAQWHNRIVVAKRHVRAGHRQRYVELKK